METTWPPRVPSQFLMTAGVSRWRVARSLRSALARIRMLPHGGSAASSSVKKEPAEEHLGYTNELLYTQLLAPEASQDAQTKAGFMCLLLDLGNGHPLTMVVGISCGASMCGRRRCQQIVWNSFLHVTPAAAQWRRSFATLPLPSRY